MLVLNQTILCFNFPRALLLRSNSYQFFFFLQLFNVVSNSIYSHKKFFYHFFRSNMRIILNYASNHFFIRYPLFFVPLRVFICSLLTALFYNPNNSFFFLSNSSVLIIPSSRSFLYSRTASAADFVSLAVGDSFPD